MGRADAEARFRREAESQGLTFPRGVEDDDKWHTVPLEGGGKGCYRYTSNGKPRGLFRRWSGDPVAWVCPDEVWATIKAEERTGRAEYLANVEKARREKEGADAELAATREEAAKKAREVWASSVEADPAHPYLVRKGVKAWDLRMNSEGDLLVPLRRGTNNLRGYQRIQAKEGAPKLYAKGMDRAGTYHVIAGSREVVAVCEGYATGATIAQATGWTVLCAMDTSQLATVAVKVRDALPDALLVIAADDDWKRDDNPGRRAAKKAATQTGGLVVLPEFGPDRGEKETDWNDLHLRAGLGEVRRQLREAIEAGEPAEETEDSGPHAPPVETGHRSGLYAKLSNGSTVQLPEGYQLDDGSGIARQAVDRNGSPIKVRVCFPPVFLVARSLDIATQTHFVTLATGWPALGSRMLHVPLEAVASTRSIVALASRGLPVTSNTAKGMVDYLDAARQLADLRLSVVSRLSATTGWVDGSFVRGYDEVHFPTGATGDLHMAPLEGEMRSKVEAVRARGSFEVWKETTERVLGLHPRVGLAFGAAVVAPLIEIIGCEQFVLDVWGESSGGKSTSLKWAASVFGSASLVGQWNDTGTAVERVAGSMRGLPVFRDETQHMIDNFGVVSAFVYAMTQGRGKARGTVTGTQTTVEFQNIALSTGESSIATMGKQAGTVARLVSVKAPMFGDNSSATSDLIHEVTGFYSRNHGTAGQAYIQRLVELSEGEKAKAAAEYRDLAVRVYEYAKKDHAARDTTRRVSNHVAAMEYAWAKFCELVAVKWEKRGPFGLFSAADLFATFDQAKEADKPSLAMDALLAWFASNQKRVQYYATTPDSNLSTIGKVWKMHDGTVRAAMLPHEVERFLGERGYAVDSVIAAISEKGWFEKSPDRRRTWKVRIGGGDVRAFVLSPELSEQVAEFEVAPNEGPRRKDEPRGGLYPDDPF